MSDTLRKYNDEREVKDLTADKMVRDDLSEM